jgi:stringent starvation protein B
MNAAESTSTRPYLIRALYEWCTDNGFTPYVAVSVDDSVQVPREYVKNNEIVLNISFDATSSLKLGNDFIEFKARFAGSAREIMVPITHVIAIYARENGQGMAFPMTVPGGVPVSAGPEPRGEEARDSTATSPSTSNGDGAKIMQLVVDSSHESLNEGENATEHPEPPDSPPRPRTPLKRIK